LSFNAQHLSESVAERVRVLRSRLRHRDPADQATHYWANLPGYHETNDDDPAAMARSRWLADVLVPELGIGSLLEVGTNSGRNLAVVKATHPDVEVLGIDVNERAIEWGRKTHPDVEFLYQDANRWAQKPNSFDAILTMSVLDHVPDEAIDTLAKNMVATASKYVICVELWDGADAERAAYKYSRDTRSLFERHGAKTVRWEQAPGQYDTGQSLLWLYVGATEAG
jgi:SAM-dependent methyltransferase